MEILTDKERLEEIKEWFNADEEIHEFQIEWLIEKVEELERLIEKERNTHDWYVKHVARQEEVLKEIKHFAMTQDVIEPYQVLGRINAQLGEESCD